MRYTKKPVTIEAKELFFNTDSQMSIIDWVNSNGGIAAKALDGGIFINTLEGRMTANSGDFIIKGVKGEFYPCKPDIFEATYSPEVQLQKTDGTIVSIVEAINQTILHNKENPFFNDDLISDGWHTFGELYEFRKMYNAALFNEWAKPIWLQTSFGWTLRNNQYDVHKSWKHNDGEYCFGEEKKWFIVSAMLPTGLISNHYKAEDWDLFKVPEVEKALFEFDGHTGADVLDRLKKLI